MYFFFPAITARKRKGGSATGDSDVLFMSNARAILYFVLGGNLESQRFETETNLPLFSTFCPKANFTILFFAVIRQSHKPFIFRLLWNQPYNPLLFNGLTVMKKITFYADDDLVRELAELEKMLGVKTTTAAIRHVVRQYRRDNQVIADLQQTLSSMRSRMRDVFNALNARKQADKVLRECSKQFPDDMRYDDQTN